MWLCGAFVLDQRFGLPLNVLQVDEVKNIMVDNIEKVLERGEKIELLVDKADGLRDRVILPTNHRTSH